MGETVCLHGQGCAGVPNTDNLGPEEYRRQSLNLPINIAKQIPHVGTLPIETDGRCMEVPCPLIAGIPIGKILYALRAIGQIAEDLKMQDVARRHGIISMGRGQGKSPKEAKAILLADD